MIINDGEKINDYQINITADERIIVSLEAEDQKWQQMDNKYANWTFSHQIISTMRYWMSLTFNKQYLVQSILLILHTF